MNDQKILYSCYERVKRNPNRLSWFSFSVRESEGVFRGAVVADYVTTKDIVAKEVTFELIQHYYSLWLKEVNNDI